MHACILTVSSRAARLLPPASGAGVPSACSSPVCMHACMRICIWRCRRRSSQTGSRQVKWWLGARVKSSKVRSSRVELSWRWRAASLPPPNAHAYAHVVFVHVCIYSDRQDAHVVRARRLGLVVVVRRPNRSYMCVCVCMCMRAASWLRKTRNGESKCMHARRDARVLPQVAGNPGEVRQEETQARHGDTARAR